jgi:hypothetical protein
MQNFREKPDFFETRQGFFLAKKVKGFLKKVKTLLKLS